MKLVVFMTRKKLDAIEKPAWSRGWNIGYTAGKRAEQDSPTYTVDMRNLDQARRYNQHVIALTAERDHLKEHVEQLYKEIKLLEDTVGKLET